MSYAAAVSLKWSLNELYTLFKDFGNIHCPESYIFHLYQMAGSLQAFDFEESSLGLKSLEKEIRDALWKAEDVVDSCMLSHFLSPSEDIVESSSTFPQDILEIIQELEILKEKAEKLADDLKHGVNDESISKYVSATANSSNADLPSQWKNKMIGLDGELEYLKHYILGDVAQKSQLGGIAIDGMAGIGKTSLATLFYNDSDVRSHFSAGAWVKISLKHCVRDILLHLLHTVEVFGQGRLCEKNIYKSLIEKNDNVDRLANVARNIFALQKRYVVVVDCLCEINNSSWGYIKSLLPDSNNGSRVILVNRFYLKDDDFIIFNHEKSFLDTSQSWDLLRQQVFGDESCPRELERIGKRIAKNCQGLPLAIITTGLHLAKQERTTDYWNKLAEKGNSAAYAAEGEPMYRQLGLSYQQMPQHFRPIFLYMGAFPENHKTPLIELRDVGHLWMAERFLDIEERKTVKEITVEAINYFRSRNLILMKMGEIDGYTCSLHHAVWHYCCTKAEEDEFFHVMDRYISDLINDRGMYTNHLIRRLVVRKNVLFGVSELEHSLVILSTMRSLLLTGKYHSYPFLQIYLNNYKMLRVLNARSIRFYEFPAEILNLTLLSYIALTLNGGGGELPIPIGISKMKNFEFLIVDLHQIVRSFGGAPSYLPMEIWEMQQLIHLQVMGSDLPVPLSNADALLPKLVILWGVSPHSCSKEVLERIPNLQQLQVSINLAPKNDTPLLSPFDNLFIIKKIKRVECLITNPYFEGCPQSHMFTIPESFSVSMDSLTMLSLSGCGFPWKQMEHISQLPFLESLELRCHAFRGPKWELTIKGFKRLEILLLEDLDLVHWTTTSRDNFFPCLSSLKIWGCHKLQQIPADFVRCPHLDLIEVVNSSLVVETWAESMQTEPSQKSGISLLFSSARGATYFSRPQKGTNK